MNELAWLVVARLACIRDEGRGSPRKTPVMAVMAKVSELVIGPTIDSSRQISE